MIQFTECKLAFRNQLRYPLLMTQIPQRKRAPYAPAASVLTAIRRYRERGLPEPVDQNILESIGVSRGNAGVTLTALKFFGLLNQEGRHSEKFDAIKRATAEEYPSVFLSILQNSYADVFVIVDPATDPRDKIDDAFRQYEPAAQRERMVVLFVGLCKEAGVNIANGEPGTQRDRKPVAERQTRGKPPERKAVQSPSEANIATELPPIDILKSEPRVNYELVAALMRQLPTDGRWLSNQRDRWLKALTANIDLIIEITDESSN
jgi:hypothetical protein